MFRSLLMSLRGLVGPSWPDGAPGVVPFAVFLLPAGDPGVSACSGPPAVVLSVHPDRFHREIGRPTRLPMPPTKLQRLITDVQNRLLGFLPAGNPFRRQFAGGRYCLGLAPLSGLWTSTYGCAGATLETSSQPSASGDRLRFLSTPGLWGKPFRDERHSLLLPDSPLSLPALQRVEGLMPS